VKAVKEETRQLRQSKHWETMFALETELDSFFMLLLGGNAQT
jgi:hypothetical protein